MSKNKIKESADTMLKQEKIRYEEPIVEPKKKSQHPTAQDSYPVITNVYRVKTANIPVYRYDVVMHVHYPRKDGSGMATALITKKTFGGDATQQDLYTKCREVFILAREKDEALKEAVLYYDLQSILYSLKPLNLPEEAPHKIHLPADELKSIVSDPKLFEGAHDVVMEIQKVTKDFQLTLKDFTGGVSHNLWDEDRSLAQFIDVASSQHAYFDPGDHMAFGSHRSYLMDPGCFGYTYNTPQSDLPSFDNGAYLGIGVEKATHWIEGERDENLAMVVETKKTPFHMCQSLLEKFGKIVRDIDRLQNGDLEKARRILIGIEFRTVHLSERKRFTIKNIIDASANRKRIEVGGEEMTVAEYYKKTHNRVLSKPDLPLIETRGPCYFPIELCDVVDGQRVRTEQQTSRQVQEMIKKCAVPPAKHREDIDRLFRALHLSDSKYLQAAQVEISPRPYQLDARRLQSPDLLYGANGRVRIGYNGTWVNPNGFVTPAGCNKWVAYAILGQRDRLSMQDLWTFIEMFVGEARKRGVQIPQRPHKEPLITTEPAGNLKKLDAIVKADAADGCDFLVLVHGDLDDNVHAYTKLAEQRYSIVTQEFRVSTVNKVAQSRQKVTMENIVNKTNVKLGGLNYTLFSGNQVAKFIIGSDTLILGISVNHPSGGRKGALTSDSSGDAEQKSSPSVVGYAANVGQNDDFEFVGDFIFQEYLGEIDVATTMDVMDRCIKLRSGRGRPAPKHILLYRNECSQGWYQFILSHEVPLIKSKLRKAGWADSKLTMIVASKLQSVRFFKTQINPRDRPMEQNVQPGIVIDTTIVHPVLNEFFLNSHRALQGTAKTPKYTVVVDENHYSLAQLEEITYQLCYGHQIVCMPTSLPSPIYIANRYAERGRKIFTQHAKTDGSYANDFSAATEQLSYRSKPGLNQRRVNA